MHLKGSIFRWDGPGKSERQQWKQRVLGFVFAGIWCGEGGSVSAATHGQMPESQRAYFENYCFSCHNADKQKGKVRLDDLPFTLSNVQTAERWQKVLAVTNAGEMPPAEEKQPKPGEKTEFLEALSKQMVVARKALSDTGGQITMRRLNRREYVNTMRDLLDVAVDPRDLPADDDGGTFDTIGSGLFFSSDQFQQYLKLARVALDDALVIGPAPSPRSGRIEPEQEVNRHIQGSHDRYAADKKRYEEWKAAGGPPSKFGFDDEGEAVGRMRLYDGHMPGLLSYMAEPLTKAGVVLQAYTGVLGQHSLRIPHNVPPGRYMVRVRIAAMDSENPRYLEAGIHQTGAGAGEMEILRCVKITASLDAPQILEIPVTVTRSGSRQVDIRERRHNTAEAAYALMSKRGQENNGDGYRRTIWVDWMEWEGPFVDQWPPHSHTAVLGNEPLPPNPGEAEARRVIQQFSERAMRGRSLNPEFLDRLLSHYNERVAAGEPFQEAIKSPLSILLASPSFLYVAERSTAKSGPSLLSDTELANRLSYFLWSSPPDQTLLELARDGRIRDASVLSHEVDRMLADEKVMRFISGFTHQWLHMVRLEFFQYNQRLHPKFDGSVKNSARREVYETLRLVLDRNLPLGVLLKSNFVVVNDILAEYYGIAGVSGAAYRSVEVPVGKPRGGLLGMAAILAMGSDGDRSSPVERGAWIVRKLLNEAPPPAPANVPQLSRFSKKLMPAKTLMVSHMEQPQCANCHRRIDPLGFGLENFNAVGQWREEEYTEIPVLNAYAREVKMFPIDASGTMPDGKPFNGFFQLRDAVSIHEAAFAKGLVEHLIEFALGRPCGFSDETLIEGIFESARNEGYTPRALIQALVKSKAFQSK
jgi:hypothetical protein